MEEAAFCYHPDPASTGSVCPSAILKNRFMNYLSHGYRFFDQPLFLAGTIVPDWLSVVNRRVRARKRLVLPVVHNTKDDRIRQVGLGILQHHHDDDTFHRCEHFMQLEAQLAAEFRQHMPDKFDHRPGFLGHIVVELMLDNTIAANHPTYLDRFYEAVGSVDAELVQTAVNQMSVRKTDKLAWFIGRFLQERFLYDYADDRGMFFRLNQVLTRVRLPHMPDSCLSVLSFARELLHVHGRQLLDVVEGTPCSLPVAEA